MHYPKPKKNKDRKYLDWVKSKQCCIKTDSGIHIIEDYGDPFTWMIDPHHIDRSDDRSAIPMCRYHHRCWHDYPDDKFRKLFGGYKARTEELIKFYNKEYEVENGKSLSVQDYGPEADS